jgi:hypothetical protein
MGGRTVQLLLGGGIMSFVGQPENYSDILFRIFVASSVVGFVACQLLASVSPETKALMDVVDVEGAFGIIGSVKLLYIAIPATVGMVFRWITLHDRISSLLGIRLNFDVDYILGPMANKVAVPVPSRYKLRTNRTRLMRAVFYKFASFEDPRIDTQLVRGAADSWGWFWCCVEPQAVILLTAIGFATCGAWWHVLGCSIVSLMLVVIAGRIMKRLQAIAIDQVGEILRNPEFRKEVEAAF